MGKGMEKGKKQGTGKEIGKNGMVGTNNGWEDNDYNNNYEKMYVNTAIITLLKML